MRSCQMIRAATQFIVQHPILKICPLKQKFWRQGLKLLIYWHHILKVEKLACSVVPVLVKQFYQQDRKSTRLNSSHVAISYAVFCLKKKKKAINLHKLARS